MSGIFISYRRADSPDATGRVYDRLVAEFGKEHVFKDIDSIPLGMDFRTHLNDRVADCTAVLAVIGPHWADQRDASGRRRLDDADDFVRIELEAALSRNIPVVPVLVGHTQMPEVAQLPASLAQLAYRQSIEVRPDPDFHNDATRLVSALRSILGGNDWAPVAHDAPRGSLVTRRQLVAAWSVAAIGLCAALGVALHWRAPPVAAAPTVRFTVAPPDKSRFSRLLYSTPAGLISPDGTKIVFPVTVAGVSSLWIRSFDSTVSQPLRGTDNATPGCWSPDGKSLAFKVGNRLKRIEIASTVVTGVTDVASQHSLCAWNRDGVILSSDQPLQRVDAAGGVSAPANQSKVGADANPAGQRYPSFLPDGRHYLFVTSVTEPDVWMGTLDAPGEAVHLMKSDSQVVYASGYLLYLSGNTLLARPFDADTRSFRGDAVPIAEHVRSNVNRIGGLAAFSVSANGWLAYQQNLGTEVAELTLLDRSGKRAGKVGEPTDLFDAVYSPDRKRIAAVITETTRGGSTSDIWIYDVQSGLRTRLTSGPVIYNTPRWSPDGSTLVYFSYQKLGTYRKAADGSSNEELLMANSGPRAFSPDGKFLAYVTPRTAKGTDIGIIADPLGPLAAVKSRLLVQSPGNDDYPEFSPDGKWLSYQSDESGRNEIYVTPFPGPGTRRQVSTEGGTRARWNPNGRELLYISADRRLMSAEITLGAVPQVGAVRALFGDFTPAAFDISLDGQHLLAIMDPPDKAEEPITIVQNWPATLNTGRAAR